MVNLTVTAYSDFRFSIYAANLLEVSLLPEFVESP